MEYLFRGWSKRENSTDRALAGIHIINVWNVSEKTVLLFFKQKRPKKIGFGEGEGIEIINVWNWYLKRRRFFYSLHKKKKHRKLLNRVLLFFDKKNKTRALCFDLKFVIIGNSGHHGFGKTSFGKHHH